jgi:hypothetical protein
LDDESASFDLPRFPFDESVKALRQLPFLKLTSIAGIVPAIPRRNVYVCLVTIVQLMHELNSHEHNVGLFLAYDGSQRSHRPHRMFLRVCRLNSVDLTSKVDLQFHLCKRRGEWFIRVKLLAIHYHNIWAQPTIEPRALPRTYQVVSAGNLMQFPLQVVKHQIPQGVLKPTLDGDRPERWAFDEIANTTRLVVEDRPEDIDNRLGI